MNITYNDKEQIEEYDPSLWNAQDANEVKNAVNSKADKTELAAKADVSALSGKADKVNGVVPLSQLPEAVLNTNQFETLADGTIGIRTSYLLSLGLTTGGGTNPDPGNTNITPAAPVLSADDSSNILIASHALGDSEIVVSTNNSSFVQYTGAIAVGDIARAAGYWKFKVKAATGRNESPVANSPAFTVAPVGNTTPSAPTSGVVNDSANTFGFTLSTGIALSGNYEYTLNGGTTTANVTANPISVGNVALAVGQVGVRVKAATGRNASAWLFNTAAFTLASTDPIDFGTPVTTWISEPANAVTVDGNTVTVNIQDYVFVKGSVKLPASGIGFLMYDLTETSDADIVLGVSSKSEFTNPEHKIRTGSLGDHKFLAVFNYNQYLGSSVVVPFNTPNAKGRIRFDGTTMFAEYTLNAGQSWTSIGSFAQPQVDLFVHAFADKDGGNVIGATLNNISQKGFIPA